MSLDNVRAALQLLSGAGEVTRAKALDAANSLLSAPAQLPGARGTTERAGQLAGQVSTLADELVAAAAANQENIRALVRHEIEGQLQKVGLASSGELQSARAEIDRLKSEVSNLRRGLAKSGPGPSDEAPVARKRPTRKAIADRSASNPSSPSAPKAAGEASGTPAAGPGAKKVPAKKVVKKVPAKAPAATSAQSPGAAAKAASPGAPAKKAPVKKAVKKALGGPTKKSTGGTTTPVTGVESTS
ncbi:hypothetical protein [Luteipulveratus mongoliensis]|uniref:hypothetical protein n=1 Tax=Luteipulveratus mongoliensis TaxID=571913 RepID=UPI0006964F4D|nr:hypothetical protein [Luteipulveratus mongoliensis]